MSPTDREANRFSARAARYARVGANVGGVAARIAGSRLFGFNLDRGRNAMELAAALGGLKGPIMKVAQLMATIPDVLPPEYAAELMKLQSQAPPMGWAVRQAAHERGTRTATGRTNSPSFEHHPAAAASLGQVHRARAHDGAELACKLQYPDMQSAVEADLKQLQLIFAIHRRMDPVIDTTEIGKEIGARIREELDYRREAKHVQLYRSMLDGIDADPRARKCGRSCRPAASSPSTGSKAAACSTTRATISRRATASARRCSPPGGGRFSRFGVIHGDPHLGNYSVFAEGSGSRRKPAGINLLDYGCIRIFPPKFVRRRGRPLPRAAHRRPRSASCTPTRPGASSGSPAN